METSPETSEEFAVGLTVSLSAGISIGIPEIGTEITTSVIHGWTATAGFISRTKERTYPATPTIMVPPLSTVTAVISGNVVQVDIPFTADLTTTYKNENRSTATPISGVYTVVETGRFTITYERPLGRSNARVR